MNRVTAPMWEPQAETLPREQLAQRSIEGMRRTLGRALTKAAWRRRLGAVTPDDIRGHDDWARLPFLTKDELRDAYPFGLACVQPRRIVRVQMSSGTTGNPIINPYSRGDVEQWAAVMARCYLAAGVGRRDVVQITPSFGLFTGGFGFHYGAERIGAMVVPSGAGRTSLQLALMRDLGATALAAISTYPLRLIEVARAEGFDLRSLKLRVAILGSEMWSDDLRSYIERELALTAFDIIGMTETGGPGMGIECHLRDGIHVWDDHYLPEIVDPASGRVLPEGESGELVVTTLTRQGLPLIRYRTRDITRVRSRERCGCGRTGVRLDRFRGRTDDMVIFKGVNFYPSQVEQILLRQPGLDHEYQIVLERDAARGDHLVLCVEAGSAFDRLAETRLLRELSDRLSLTPEIRRLGLGEIPRAAGKAVRVLDRRERTGAP